MFNRIARALRSIQLPSIAELEMDYLNAAESRTDLERRQRNVERGMFRRGMFDN